MPQSVPPASESSKDQHRHPGKVGRPRGQAWWASIPLFLFACDSLVDGDRLIFNLLPGSPSLPATTGAEQTSNKNHLSSCRTQRYSQRLVKRGPHWLPKRISGLQHLSTHKLLCCKQNLLEHFPSQYTDQNYAAGDIWSAKGHPGLLRPGKFSPQKGHSTSHQPAHHKITFLIALFANFLCFLYL